MGKVKIEFRVSYAERKHGESVWVVGSDPGLGAWHPGSGLELRCDPSTEEKLLMCGSLRFEETGSQCDEFQYKYIVCRTDGMMRWEEGPNRRAALHAMSHEPSGSRMLIEDVLDASRVGASFEWQICPPDLAERLSENGKLRKGSKRNESRDDSESDDGTSATDSTCAPCLEGGRNPSTETASITLKAADDVAMEPTHERREPYLYLLQGVQRVFFRA